MTMASSLRAGGLQELPLNNPRYTARTTMQEYRWPIWLFCSTISLLSSRNLLIERYQHYPKQLYINQLIAAVAIALCLHSWPRGNQPASEQQQRLPRQKRRGRPLLLNAHFFLVAQSMLCTMQAILHFTNFPVFIMIASIAFFTEGLLLLVADVTLRSRGEILRIILLLFACVGILFTEYRLDVQNLLAAVPAMLCAGVAGALRKFIDKRYPEDSGDTSLEHVRLIGMGAVAAVPWVVLPGADEHLMMFTLKNTLLLAINAFSTGAAMLLGGSIIFPMNLSGGLESQRIAGFPLRSVRDALALPFLASIAGCVASLHIRRPYISWYQFWCFVLAIVCIGYGTRQTKSRGTSRQGDGAGDYELVSDPAQSRDVIPTIMVEDFDTEQSRTRQPESRGTIRGCIILAGITLLLWVTYFFLNFNPRPRLRVDSKLDQKYAPTVPLEVIISMYKEPIHEVAEAISHMKGTPAFSEAIFTIYLKDQEADTDKIKQQSGAKSVTVLPNIGREGGTYLHHIIERWDSLAKQTIFLQAEIHNPREFWPHLNYYFVPDKTGFLSLGWSGTVCNCDSCSDRFYWQDDTQLFPALQRRINGEDTCREVLLSYKGQFVVSAARIRAIDKSIYQDLWGAFANETSWAHQEEYVQGRKDSLSAPLFGYTVERIWNLLFQCSDMDIAWKCPTLLSKWRIGGNVGDCQCFD